MLRGVALLVTLGICGTPVGAAAAPNDPAQPAPLSLHFVTPTQPGVTTSVLRMQPAGPNGLLTRFPMVVVQADASIDPIPAPIANPAYFPLRVIVPDGVAAPGTLLFGAPPPLVALPGVRFLPPGPLLPMKTP